MPEIEIRDATRADANYIAAYLRDADRAELAAAGVAPHEVARVVRQSVASSDWARVVVVDGVPAIVYGVGPYGFPAVGVAWMLATAALLQIRRRFLTGGVEEMARMKERYRVLFNRVHRDNMAAIRWLTRLGFRLGRQGADGFIDFWG